jgi:Kef-type K+ transport system membrane component KefB
MLLIIIFSIAYHISISNAATNDNYCLVHGEVYRFIDGDLYPMVSGRLFIYEEDILVDIQETDKNGSYSVTLEPGFYQIQVEKNRYISQTVSVLLKPNTSTKIDFFMELDSSPYEVVLILDGLPENQYPILQLDGLFYGYAVNGTRLSFNEGSIHSIELRNIFQDKSRYLLVPPSNRIVKETDTIYFQYFHQLYISSDTNYWINGWYDDRSDIHLEARDVIYIDNETRKVFNGWLKNNMLLRDNPITLRVNSSFHINSMYRKQFLLSLYSERGEVTGEGWYYENSITEVSVVEPIIEIGTAKYEFIGWSGDLESPYTTINIRMDKPKSLSTEWELLIIEDEKIDPIYKAIISISLLICAAKIFAGIFAKIKLPEVLGELSAGIVLGPYALGGIEVLYGEPLIEINEYILVFAEIGAILLLFIAGLETSFGSFKNVGLQSVIVGSFGVIIPFFLGFYILRSIGISLPIVLLVAATLTATSIAITLRTLEDLGKLNSVEGSVMINSAVIDDVLGLVVLAVVMSIVTAGITPNLFDVTWILFRTIAFWLLLLAIMLIVAPRIVGVSARWKVRGTVEIVATATCFGSAVIAALIGLSPIVGAFAAGMALAGSRLIARVRDYTERLSILFSPLFFAVIGAEFNIRVLSLDGLPIILILIGIAVVSKLVGCGIPSAIMLRNIKRGFRVGVGMISRGEVGLIIAGIGVTSGIMSQNIYGYVVTMVIVTTIMAPIILRWTYTLKPKVAEKDIGRSEEKKQI